MDADAGAIRRLTSLLLAAATVAATTAACGAGPDGELAPPASCPETLRYYGYYGSGFDEPMIPDVVRPEYRDGRRVMADVAAQSNVAWIYDREAVKLPLARSAGMKVILDAHGPFFRDDDYTFIYDPQRSDWKDYSAVIAPYVIDGTVIAITPVDEPFAWGDIAGIPRATMKRALETAAQVIHAEFPSLPIALNEAGSVLPNLDLPVGFDWFGFDCYGPLEGCRVQANIDWLKSQLRPGQRLFLFPDAVLYANRPGDADERERARRIDAYLAIAAKEPLVVGLFPFLWQSFVENGARLNGLSDMGATVREHFAQVGRCVARTHVRLP